LFREQHTNPTLGQLAEIMLLQSKPAMSKQRKSASKTNEALFAVLLIAIPTISGRGAGRHSWLYVRRRASSASSAQLVQSSGTLDFSGMNRPSIPKARDSGHLLRILYCRWERRIATGETSY